MLCKVETKKLLIIAALSDMSMIAMKLTAVYMKVPEGYVAFIEELPGAN
jgi:hypothetical protein